MVAQASKGTCSMWFKSSSFESEDGACVHQSLCSFYTIWSPFLQSLDTAYIFDLEFSNFTMLITSLREQKDVRVLKQYLSLKLISEDDLPVEFWSCMNLVQLVGTSKQSLEVNIGFF